MGMATCYETWRDKCLVFSVQCAERGGKEFRERREEGEARQCARIRNASIWRSAGVGEFLGKAKMGERSRSGSRSGSRLEVKADDGGDLLTTFPLVAWSGYAGTGINGGRTFLSAITSSHTSKNCKAVPLQSPASRSARWVDMDKKN